MKKRLLSLALTLVMVLSFFPGMTITANAANETTVDIRTLKVGETVSVGTVLTATTNAYTHIFFDTPRYAIDEISGGLALDLGAPENLVSDYYNPKSINSSRSHTVEGTYTGEEEDTEISTDSEWLLVGITKYDSKDAYHFVSSAAFGTDLTFAEVPEYLSKGSSYDFTTLFGDEENSKKVYMGVIGASEDTGLNNAWLTPNRTLHVYEAETATEIVMQAFVWDDVTEKFHWAYATLPIPNEARWTYCSDPNDIDNIDFSANGSGQGSLQDAFNSTRISRKTLYIELLKDAESYAGIMGDPYKTSPDIVLDMKGYDLIVENDDNDTLFGISYEGNLTIKNTTNEDSSIIVSGNNAWANVYGIEIDNDNDKTFVLDNCDLSVTGCRAEGVFGQTVTITKSEITVTAYGNDDTPARGIFAREALSVSDNSVIDVTGGTGGAQGIYHLVDISINNSTIRATSTGGESYGVIASDYQPEYTFKLGGEASVSGGTADVLLYYPPYSQLYAQIDEQTPYTGGEIEITFGERYTPTLGDTVVYGVDATNKGMFELAGDLATGFYLSESNGNLVLSEGAAPEVGGIDSVELTVAFPEFTFGENNALPVIDEDDVEIAITSEGVDFADAYGFGWAVKVTTEEDGFSEVAIEMSQFYDGWVALDWLDDYTANPEHDYGIILYLEDTSSSGGFGTDGYYTGSIDSTPDPVCSFVDESGNFLGLFYAVEVAPTPPSLDTTKQVWWGFGPAGEENFENYTAAGDLADAFTAANTNADARNTVTYVKLNKADVTVDLTSTLELIEGKKMVLDLVSDANTLTINGPDSRGAAAITVNGDLALKNGKMIAASTYASSFGTWSGIKTGSNSTLDISNCDITVTVPNCSAYGILTYADVTISDGSTINVSSNSKGATGISALASIELKIADSTISATTTATNETAWGVNVDNRNINVHLSGNTNISGTTAGIYLNYTSNIKICAKDGETPFSGGNIVLDFYDTNITKGQTVAVYDVTDSNKTKFKLADDLAAKYGLVDSDPAGNLVFGDPAPAEEEVVPAEAMEGLTLSVNDGTYTVNGLDKYEDDAFDWVYALGSEDEIDDYVNGEDGITKVPSGTWGAEWPSLNNNASFTNGNADNTHVLICRMDDDYYVTAYAVLPLAEAEVGGNEGGDEGGINLSDLQVGMVLPVGTVINIDDLQGAVYVDDYQTYLWEMAGRDDEDKSPIQQYYTDICVKAGISSWGNYYASYEDETTSVELKTSMPVSEESGGTGYITTTQAWLCYLVVEDYDGAVVCAYFVSPDNLGGSNSALKFAKDSYAVDKGATVTLEADFAQGTAPSGDYEVKYALVGAYASGTSVDAATGLLTVAADETATTVTVQASVYADGMLFVTTIDVTVNGEGNDGGDDEEETPEVHAVTVIVKEEISGSESAVRNNATVELVGLDGTVQTKTEGSGEGVYTFENVVPGVYNLVITVGEDENAKVKTVLVVVEDEDVDLGAVVLPVMKINSKVDVTVDVSEDSPVKGALVGGLDNLAENVASDIEVADGAEVSVDVTMNIEAQTSNAVDSDKKTEIEKVAQNQSESLTFLDIVIAKKIVTKENGEITNVDDDFINDTVTLLEIVIPFDTENREDFAVYRYHEMDDDNNNAVQKLVELQDGEDPDTVEHIEIGDDVITMYVRYFSTYAIGYSETEDDDNGSSDAPIVRPSVKPSDKPSTKPVSYDECKQNGACPLNEFSDLSATAWYHDAVHYCIDNGLMNGYGIDFRPGGVVTRQQVWMMLARLSGEDPANMAEARAWAMANAVSDGTNPTNAVTRQQFITMLYRYAQQMGYDVSSGEDTNILSYTDAFGIAEYAIPAMQWGCAEDIMGGYGDGSLKPANGATRAHVAAFLQRFCVGA